MERSHLFLLFPLFLLVAILWLQPWESQMKKLNDEWNECNTQYNGQCRYVGGKFKTNSIEMFISGVIHGFYGDEVCVRKYGFDHC